MRDRFALSTLIATVLMVVAVGVVAPAPVADLIAPTTETALRSRLSSVAVTSSSTTTTTTVPPTTEPQAPPTAAPPTTTTVPPTTEPPPPPTTAPPPPEVEAPLPAPAPAPPDGSELTGIARGRAALLSVVPAGWPTEFAMWEIPGSTSYADSGDNAIKLSTYHLNSSWAKLRWAVAHEWGHHMAFRYGTQSQLGAAPEGWPGRPDQVETWASCVAAALVGFQETKAPYYCPPAELAWTAVWLAQPPPQ